MKNLMIITSILITALISPSIIYGQTNLKGTMFVGAELASNSNDRILDLNMTPRFGYFISDKFVLGIASDRQILSRFRLSDMELFARYYLPIDFAKKKDIWRRFTFFGEVAAKSPRLVAFRDISDVDIGIKTHVGTNIRLKDKLFLEVALTPDLFNGLSLDLDPRVGIEYRFSSKKKTRK